MQNDQHNHEGHQVTLWQPTPFEGSDLLPVEVANSNVQADTRGRENVEASDLIVPSLQLLQGQSDAVTSGQVPGAVPGKFYLTSTQEVLDAPLRVLLCAHTRSRALFPQEDKPEFAGLERCVSRDALEGSTYGSCEDCPHRHWRENRKPPLCSESHNFIALTPYGPAVIRFSRTNYKTARTLLTTWTTSPKPLWAHPTMIVAVKDTKVVGGKTNTFYRMELRWLQREAVPPVAQEAAAAVHDRVSSAHEQGRFRGSDEDEDDFGPRVHAADVPY